MIMCTLVLLSDRPISLASLATQAAARIPDAEVNVVSETHVELHRGEDYTTIQSHEDWAELYEDDELTEHGIDPERMEGWLLAFPQVELFRDVVGVLAEQVSNGWIADDNGQITPFAEFREKLAGAQSVEDF